MNTKGLLTGNRVVIARKPYLQGFSANSHIFKTAKSGAKYGENRVY